jgi:hypothetical protein
MGLIQNAAFDHVNLFWPFPIVDDLVKSQKSRRSRGGGSPELLDLTGFPLSRE